MPTRFVPTWFTAAIAVASAMLLLTACGDPPGGPPPTRQGKPLVSVMELQPQRWAVTAELPGRTTPVLLADVRPQVSGIVQSRRFKEGGEVKAGDLLYQIDPASYKATVDSAQASLERAEATLVSTRLKAERYKELVGIKAVSQQDADDADAALLQAKADVASARAALQSGRINLDYTRVTAPIGGRIGRSSVTPGALVTANQATALATVQKLDPMYVDMTQSSGDLLRLRQAMAQGKLSSGAAQVKLLLQDGSTYSQVGTLKFSEVTVDTGTGAITLRAEFPNPKGELLPGMYVRAVIEEGVLEQALLVPQPAVTRNAAGKPVAFVVAASGNLEQRLLTTDRAVGDQWLVADGLKAGDRVVVEGQQKARVGEAVEVRPYSPPARVGSVANAAQPAASSSRPLASADDVKKTAN